MEMPFFPLDVLVLMLRLRRSRDRGSVGEVRRQSDQRLSLETLAGIGQSHVRGGPGGEVEGMDSWKYDRRQRLDAEVSVITHMLCANSPECTLTHSSCGAEGFQGPF